MGKFAKIGSERETKIARETRSRKLRQNLWNYANYLINLPTALARKLVSWRWIDFTLGMSEKFPILNGKNGKKSEWNEFGAENSVSWLFVAAKLCKAMQVLCGCSIGSSKSADSLRWRLHFSANFSIFHSTFHISHLPFHIFPPTSNQRSSFSLSAFSSHSFWPLLLANLSRRL